MTINSTNSLAPPNSLQRSIVIFPPWCLAIREATAKLHHTSGTGSISTAQPLLYPPLRYAVSIDHHFALRTAHSKAFVELYFREVEFLECLAAGYTLKEMAQARNRAPTTLNSHSHYYRTKLKAASLEKAVFKAFALWHINP